MLLNEQEARYKIVRSYMNDNKKSRTIKRNLTLREAQAHCSDVETSSKTCTSADAKRHTKRYGAWFDGYDVDN